MPTPTVEITVTGIQNRKILRGLLVSRLAAKNKAKNKIARSPHSGEKTLMNTPKPVAFEVKERTNAGPSMATNSAATALRAARRYVTVLCLLDSCAHILLRKSPILMGSCCEILITHDARTAKAELAHSMRKSYSRVITSKMLESVPSKLEAARGALPLQNVGV
jgi:hypothetical protein